MPNCWHDKVVNMLSRRRRDWHFRQRIELKIVSPTAGLHCWDIKHQIILSNLSLSATPSADININRARSCRGISLLWVLHDLVLP